MGDQPPSDLSKGSKEVRTRDKSSNEDPSSLTSAEVRKSSGQTSSHSSAKRTATTAQASKSVNKGSSSVTLNAAAFSSAIAEALKGSFEDLRDSMSAGFTDLGNLIASHSVDDEDGYLGDNGNSIGSKDDDESIVQPPAKKTRPDEPAKNSNPLITKTLQLTEHVGGAIDGDLASLVDKIMREKANDEKITELKKQHKTPENCTTLSETKVNQGV